MNVGDWVVLDGDKSTAGQVEAVDGSRAQMYGMWFDQSRLTPTFARCQEIRVGSAMSRKGTNQYAICNARATTNVVLRLQGKDVNHPTCGWHATALLRSPMYVSHQEIK